MDWTIGTAFVVTVLCIALAAGALHRVSVHRARGTYLTAAAGLSDRLTQSRRRFLWRQAFSYISRILRLRKRWSALGVHLQIHRIQDLVSGTSRRHGTLSRIRGADSVSAAPKAKARGQARQRVAASSQYESRSFS